MDETNFDVTDGLDVTDTLNLPADPTDQDRSVFIPATPVSPAVQVDMIPTVTLPLTKATKSHVAATIGAITGAGQVAVQFLPDGVIKTYVSAAVAVITVGALWLGVYTPANLPKFTKQ